MARLVRGYPYAYQVLGYLCYKRKRPYGDLLEEFDAYLAEYVYEKIWSELSDKDRDVLRAMVQVGGGKVESIRNAAGMPSNEFSVYRSRLLKRGLVASERFGHLEFTLPRLDAFVTQLAGLC